MARDDLDGVLALAHGQGRNVHRREYERFFDLEGAHGFVLMRDGALEGAVTVMRYFDHGFLGPVLVREGADATGLVWALASQAVMGLVQSGVPLVMAEASDADAPILAHMGFTATRRTLVLERAPAAAEGTPRTVPMEAHHLLDVGTLDASVVGYGRKEFLWALREDFPEGARVVESGGEAVGYVLLRRSRRGYHLGPLVTQGADVEVARALLEDALRAAAGWPVVVLVPEGSGLLPFLAKHGFEEVAGLVRMRSGDADPPQDGAATEWVLGGRITG